MHNQEVKNICQSLGAILEFRAEGLHGEVAC